MDMNSPFSRAWSVTWNHKYLWLLGLVAGLQLNYGDDTVGMLQGGARLFLDAPRYLIQSSVGAVLIALVLLALWLLGVVARAGLIQSVSDIERRKIPKGSLRRSEIIWASCHRLRPCRLSYGLP